METVSLISKFQLQLNLPMWEIEALTGYQPQTTFWQNFSIAEKFDLSAVQDTFNRAFNEWRKNCVYLTELVLALNWKTWYWYDEYTEATKAAKDNVRSFELYKLYERLYREADMWAVDNLQGDELMYFYRITD